MKKVKVRMENEVTGELFEEFMVDEQTWLDWEKARGDKTWSEFIKQLTKDK